MAALATTPNSIQFKHSHNQRDHDVSPQQTNRRSKEEKPYQARDVRPFLSTLSVISYTNISDSEKDKLPSKPKIALLGGYE